MNTVDKIFDVGDYGVIGDGDVIKIKHRTYDSEFDFNPLYSADSVLCVQHHTLFTNQIEKINENNARVLVACYDMIKNSKITWNLKTVHVIINMVNDSDEMIRDTVTKNSQKSVGVMRSELKDKYKNDFSENIFNDVLWVVMHEALHGVMKSIINENKVLYC